MIMTKKRRGELDLAAIATVIAVLATAKRRRRTWVTIAGLLSFLRRRTGGFVLLRFSGFSCLFCLPYFL